MSHNLEPITRKEQFYDKIVKSAGGGGGSATLIEKSITVNGEYSASSDNADGYSKVTVNVPLNFGVIKTVNSPTGDSTAVYYINNQSDEVSTFGTGAMETRTFVILNPVKKITCSYSSSEFITFTPTANFDGFYKKNNGGKITFTSGTEPSGVDNKCWTANLDFRNQAYEISNNGSFPSPSFEIVE